MKETLEKMKKDLVFYKEQIAEYEARGIENLNHTETEDLGFFRGKAEIIEDLLIKLEA